MSASAVKNYAVGLLQATADPLATWQELDQLAEVVERTPLLRQTLLNASIETASKRRQAIATTLSDFSPLIRQFVDLMIRDNLLARIRAITAAYRQALKTAHNVTDIVIETPEALSEAAQEALLARAGIDGPRIVRQEIQPGLIGGVKVIIDDIEHDFSVSGALDTLKQQLVT